MLIVLIVHLFVSYAHVNLCHFFTSFWCRGLAAAFACGSSVFFFFFSVYPFYIVVSKSVLEKVHISIKTDTGSNVPFVTEKTMIELRFRRKKIV